MSRLEQEGGPAFPSHGSMGEVAHEGMTLRDYFAAKAMQAFIGIARHMKLEGKDVNLTDIPDLAWRMADEMLEARQE